MSCFPASNRWSWTIPHNSWTFISFLNDLTMVQSYAKALFVSHSSLDVLLCLRFAKGVFQISLDFRRISHNFNFVINLDISRKRVLISTTYYHLSELTKIYNFTTSRLPLPWKKSLYYFLVLMDNELWIYFIWRKNNVFFAQEIYISLFLVNPQTWKTMKSLKMLLHIRSYILDPFFRNLGSSKMQFGEVVMQIFPNCF